MVLALVLALLGSASVSAQASYPVPHRGWVKLAAATYRADLTNAQLDFAASHFDLLDDPHWEFLDGYPSRTDAPKFVCDGFFSTGADASDPDNWKRQVWLAWCGPQGIGPEDFSCTTRTARGCPSRGPQIALWRTRGTRATRPSPPPRPRR